MSEVKLSEIFFVTFFIKSLSDKLKELIKYFRPKFYRPKFIDFNVVYRYRAPLDTV